MNLYTPEVAPWSPATTTAAVMRVVTDAALAGMLFTLSDETPKVGKRVMSATADLGELTQALLSLQVVLTITALRKTYAAPDPDLIEIDRPTRGGTFDEQCILTAYHARFLSLLLIEGQAYKEHFQATVEACAALLPMLSKMAAALVDPEEGR